MVCRDGGSSKSQQLSANLSRLNESVCRERHPIPVVEQVLAQLTGAKSSTPTVDSGRSHYHQNLLFSQHLSHHLGGSVFIGFHLASHLPQNIFKNGCSQFSQV